MDITEFRKQYPQYNDLSDSDLADALYTKFYSDMPRGTFEGHFRPSMVAEEQASQPLRETIAETEALSPIPAPMETPPLPKFSDKMKEASDTVMDAIAETASEKFDQQVEATVRPPGIYQGEGDFDTPAGALRQFTGNLLNEAGLGLPEYLSGAEMEKPGGTVEDIAAGAGKLAGFIIGAPGRVTKLVATGLRKAMPKLATSSAAPVLTRTAKLVAQEAPALGVGMASASLGEALKKDNLDDALETLGKAFVSGAAMGTTFAATRGVIPKDRIGRIATGIALLDLQRGTTPIDDRKLSQKVFDYGIDTFFLWGGMGDRGLDRLESDLKDRGVKVEEPKPVEPTQEPPTTVLPEQRTSSFRAMEDVHKSETFANPERQASENTRETVYRNVYASREPYRAEGEPPSATPRREQRATEPPVTSAETKYGWDEQRQEFKMPERVPIVDLPEIIEMVRLVNRRSVPTIAKKIRNTSTQGYFNPLTGKIKLNPNVQKDPRELAETISHEVGHLWDWMSEKERDTIKKRGNILGHIGALKEYAGEYLKEHPKSTAEVITEADISMLRQEAERQVAAEAEQKTGGLPPTPTPDEILDVWRSIDVKDKALEMYIKLLSDAEKVELVKAAMKKAELPEWFSFRRISEGAADPAKVEAVFHTLLRNEILARKLYERDTIQRELQDLSTFWRPFDVNKDRKYTKYRFKPEELYADMVSVLFNDPMLLKRFAPESYKAVFAYMDARPEMKNAYDSVISRIIDPVKLMQGRDENLQRMWDMSNVASKQGAINWQRQHPISELKHWLKVTLSEKNQRWLEHVRKVKGEGKVIRPEDNPWYWLEEGAYIDGLGFTYLNHINVEPFRLYKESGVSEADFKSYLFLRRLSEYEDQKLNPLGHTKESADKFLYEYLPQKYGEDIVAKLDAVSDAWFKVRQDIVFPIIEQSRILRPDWMELIKSRKYYVKFNAIREFKTMGLDEETVGYFYRPPEGLGKLYARVGSAKEIENPFVSTIRQDMALMRAAHRKLTADSMVRFLQENFPDEVRPAIYEQQVRRYALAPQGMQTIRFMEQGKVKAWNIPVELAQMFADNHYKADVAVRAMDLFGNFFQRVSALPKRLMVTNNPIFVLWNTLYRDPKAFYRHIEEVGIKDVTWHILKNIKPTWDHVFRGKPHELLDEMYRNFMLITKRHYGTEAVTPDLEVDRMFMSWGLKPEDYTEKALSPFAKVLDALEKPLEFGEKLIKVAGYSFLKESPVKRSTKEMAHIVRTRIGTPDSRRAGLAMKFYNNLFMYSNIAKEGVRASIEAMRVSPFSFFYKTTIMDILPKALMYAASIGVFDQINPDMKRIMDGFSDYLKQNYIMIPIGLDNTGNSVGFIMPQDYTGQIIGGMFWLTATMNRNDDLLNFNKYMLNQIPYAGLNPVLQLAIDYSRYIAGVNPFDSYTGGNVIPDNTWKAGRWSFESWKAMMKHTFNTLGMSAIWQRLDNRPKVQVQSWLKDLMNVPVAGKVLERFIRVDNIGKLQEIYNELRPIEEGRYQELNDMDRVIFDALAYDDPTHKGKFNLSPERIMQLYDGLYKEGKLRRHTPDQFAERYRNAAIMASNPVWFKAWLYATNEERIKILTMYMDQKRRSK